MRRTFLKTVSRSLALLLIAGPLLAASPVRAQRHQDPLTDQEADQVADLRDQPNARLKLYQKFVQQRIDAIKTLGTNPAGDDRKADLRAKYEEFTHICDELQDNLDTFDEAHADIRKSLKDLVPATTKWLAILNQAAADRAYDFARKTAVDCAQSTSDDATKTYEAQKKFFAEHKSDRNKNGSGPT